MASCFDRKTVIIRLIKNIFKVQQSEHSPYPKNVLYWPDDDRLTVETCCHNVIWVYIPINITIQIYSCV